MQVEQVDFVSVPTRDSARAVAWYRDVLGLQVSEYSDAEIETSNVTLAFWNPESQGEPFEPNPAVRRWASSTPACATWASSRTSTETC